MNEVGAARGSELEETFTLGSRNGAQGFFVIDHRVRGLAGGGIRVAPDLTLEELSQLARAMTLKYAFLNLPIGGAKAGIALADTAMRPAQRRSYLEALGRHLAPFRSHYLPGRDMGTNDEDLDTVLLAMGLRPPRRNPDSAYYTALAVLTSVEEVLRQRSRQITGCSFAIEGFGAVGGWLARLVDARGGRITAVSTREASVSARGGLDVVELLRLRRIHGHDCVKEYGGDWCGEPDELPSLFADVLLPCAGSASVDAVVAQSLKADIVVPAANNAVTDEAREVLDGRGRLAFPDFVASGGGVLGSAMERLGIARESIEEVIDSDFRQKVRRLLSTVGLTSGELQAGALQIAGANLERRRQRGRLRRRGLLARAVKAVRRERLPAFVTRGVGLQYVRHRLRHS